MPLQSASASVFRECHEIQRQIAFGVKRTVVRPAAAIADYTAALAIEPGAASSLYGRGLAEKLKGDQSAAEADFAAATKLQPDIIEQYAKWGIPPPHR